MRNRVNRMVPFLVLGLILILIAMACETEDPSLRANEPRVKMVLKPTGTKMKLDTMITHNADSLALVRNAILGQTDPDKRLELIGKLTVLKADSIQYAGKKVLFDRGQVMLNRVVGIGGNADNYFQDSLVTSIALPLHATADSASYIFFYDDLIDTLKLAYQRKIIQTIDGIRYSVFDLQESEDTFDSLKIICRKRNCSNDGTTIEAYF